MADLKIKDQYIKISDETDRYLGFLASMKQQKKQELAEKLIGKRKKNLDNVNKLLFDKSKKELDEHIKGSARLKRSKKSRKKKKSKITSEEKPKKEE